MGCDTLYRWVLMPPSLWFENHATRSGEFQPIQADLLPAGALAHQAHYELAFEPGEKDFGADAKAVLDVQAIDDAEGLSTLRSMMLS